MSQELCIIGSWLICVLAAERIAEILVHGEIFAEWRVWVSRKANPEVVCPHEVHIDVGTWSLFFWKKLAKLSTCGFCMSTWTSLLMVGFLPGPLFELTAAGSIVTKVFALMFLTNLVHATFRLVDRGRIRTYDHEINLSMRETNNGGDGEIS